MQVQLEVEIDSKGIIGQMEKVRNAEIKMRQEMDKLNEMLQTASAKETGNSEESPAKEICMSIVSERMTSRFCSLLRTRCAISRRVKSLSSDWRKS